jgi:hypothetical protein
VDKNARIGRNVKIINEQGVLVRVAPRACHAVWRAKGGGAQTQCKRARVEGAQQGGPATRHSDKHVLQTRL